LLTLSLMPIYPAVPVVVLFLLGLWGHQASRRPPAGKHDLVSLFAAEELLAASLLQSALFAMGGGSEWWQRWGCLGLWVAGMSLLLLSQHSMRLPAGLLPVRGRWLRYLLVSAGMAALFAAGPWWWLVGACWMMGRNGWGIPAWQEGPVWYGTAILLSVTLALFFGSLWRAWALQPDDR